MNQLKAASPKGMMTAPHHLAARSGLDVLKEGGNALEAMAAAAATLTVVYPQMCTLGGDAFGLLFNAKEGRLVGINASGKSGRKVSRELYRGMQAIPARDPLSAITVPGLVSGLELLLKHSREHLGGSMELPRLFRDAVHFAEEGFPVSRNLALWLEVDLQKDDPENHDLGRFSEFAKIFLPFGKIPKEGDILRQPDLAKTFRRLCEAGLRDFYEGETMERLVEGLKSVGGYLEREDFVEHRALCVEPLTMPWRGKYTACNLPPNCQGLTSLEILGILDRFDIKGLGDRDPLYYHLMVEATKLAFVDRDAHVTDPDHHACDAAALLAPDRLARLAASIDTKRAQTPLELATLSARGDTVWLGCVDAHGNAVSWIQSVYHDFGSGLIPQGTGVLLQNRGSFFSLDEHHINVLAPRKRTMHTLNPPMILENGRPRLVYGTMGGDGQPQTQAALATRILDLGMDPAEAIAAPRWLYGRAWGNASTTLKLERRIPESIGLALAALGHDVEYVEEYSQFMGHAGAILVGEDGYEGASDPRSDGAALGL